MVTESQLHSDLAIPPGEYLAEVIEDLALTQAELAKRMGRPSQAINEIVLGKKSITAETALQLESVTGVPAHIWTGLEEEYRLVLARQEESQLRLKEAEEIDPDLYRSMVKLGWVAKARKPEDKARELCRFLGVAALSNVKDTRRLGYAFRISDRAKASRLSLAAWLRKAELEAQSISTEPFDANRLRDVLGKLRKLTFEEPEHWLPAAKEMLVSAGVALVVIPHLPQTYANGATFWLSHDKAVVVVSLRGSWADIFWFTLFHELGHVKLHNRKDPHISFNKSTEREEVEANKFAAELLIPSKAFQDFVFAGRYSEKDVTEFSAAVGVSPGIVVGRLQHQKIVPHSQLNGLRERYEFSKSA